MRRYAPWLLLLSSCGGVAAAAEAGEPRCAEQAILEPVFRYELQQFIGRDESPDTAPASPSTTARTPRTRRA